MMTTERTINPTQVLKDYFDSPLLALRGMGNYETFSRFFEPTTQFIQWCKDNYPEDIFIDCGCGLGHVTRYLRNEGLTVFALDLYPSSFAVIDDILPIDSVIFTYTEGMVPLMCRPCRGEWIHATIVRAVESCGVMLYVGKESHYNTDLLPLPYKVERIMEDAGEMEEILWRITL